MVSGHSSPHTSFSQSFLGLSEVSRAGYNWHWAGGGAGAHLMHWSGTACASFASPSTVPSKIIITNIYSKSEVRIYTGQNLRVRVGLSTIPDINLVIGYNGQLGWLQWTTGWCVQLSATALECFAAPYFL